MCQVGICQLLTFPIALGWIFAQVYSGMILGFSCMKYVPEEDIKSMKMGVIENNIKEEQNKIMNSNEYNGEGLESNKNMQNV